MEQEVALDDGSRSVTATAYDVAGNSFTTDALLLTVDSSPTILSIAVGASVDTAVLPGLVTGPTEAFLNGVAETGKERLGPASGYGISSGRSSAGNSPRIKI